MTKRERFARFLRKWANQLDPLPTLRLQHTKDGFSDLANQIHAGLAAVGVNMPVQIMPMIKQPPPDSVPVVADSRTAAIRESMRRTPTKFKKPLVTK